MSTSARTRPRTGKGWLKVISPCLLGLVAAAVARVLLSSPSTSTCVGMGALVGLGVAGFLLWLEEDPRHHDLGTAFLGGLVVAAALGFVEYQGQRDIDGYRDDLEEQRVDDQRDEQRQQREEDTRFALATQQDLTGLDLREESLAGYYMRHKQLETARLTDSKLMGAVMQRSDLYDSDLRGANLAGANMIGVDLCGAALDRSVKTGRSANLRRADLWRASLYETHIDDNTDLRNARLENADLRAPRFARARLEGATYDARTTLPRGFTDADAAAAGMEKLKEPRGEPGLRVKSRDTGCPPG